MQIKEDPLKVERLQQMKRRATGLLLAASALFLVTRWLESVYPWLGYARAFSEAAMIGGVADWFAVTALFRHPLGIPIPHTAIVPTRKDRIGRALGGFVQNNFLSREVLSDKLRSKRIAEAGATWLVQPANTRSIARHVAAALAAAAHVVRDEEVQELIDQSLVSRARKVQVAPVLGNVLSLFTTSNRHQALFDRFIHLIARLVDENEEVIRAKIRDESPWWVPDAVDARIHNKVVTAIESTLHAMADDPAHPLRHRYDEMLKEFIEKLKTSPETIARAEEIKEELLAHPSVRQFSGAIWQDMKGAVERYSNREDDRVPGAIERALSRVGTTALADPELLAKIDEWVIEGVLYVVEQYRDEVGQLIAQTVQAWDPEVTSRRIELAIGRDLQFIRINGTLVGGLVGLLIYAVSQMIE
jgi:uncharacterized membrane-anchored protein YjiN (DUF445 family)